MKSVAMFAIAIALALALVPAAGAKGPASGRVCGLSGCKPLANAQVVIEALLSAPFVLADAPAPAPHFRVVFTSAGRYGPHASLVYVPARRLLLARAVLVDSSSGPYWRTMSPRAERLLRRITRGMTPYRAARRWR